jgi:RecA/RadA recombinase
MSNFFTSLVEQLKDDDTKMLSDGGASAEYSGCIDTGSYALNAVLSGSIYGGVPNNKVTAFAGESSTGKTFFVLGIVKQFLDANPEGGVIYFDTEAAVTKNMMESRGVDTTRVVISEPDTIQKFRHTALQIIDKYQAQPEAKRKPMIMVLDSLGQLSSTKEMEDTAEGKETKDMTKSAILKATFRVLNLKLAKIGVPLLVTNHVYDVVGAYIPTKEMSGGSGLKYTASTIVYLSKRKDKDGTEVVGNIVRCKLQKSRLTKENSQVEVKITYSKGLDRYYGLLELAEKHGIIKKVSTRYELSNGVKVFGKNINENPEKYYTPDILAQIDEACKKEFLYGQDGKESYDEDAIDEVEEITDEV